VDFRLGGPTVDEHADGHEERCGETGKECVFRGSEPVLGDARGRVPFDPGHVDECAYAEADGRGEESDAEFAEVEVVDVDVDEWEGFEEGVEEGVHEGSIDGCECNGRVEGVELEGTIERINCHGVERQIALVYLALRHQFRRGVGVGEAEAASAIEQDRASACLGHESEHDEEGWAGEPEYLPQRPVPILCCDGEAGDHGTDGRTSAGGEGPETD